MATYNCSTTGIKSVGCKINFNCTTNIVIIDKNVSNNIAILTSQVWNNYTAQNVATKNDVYNAALISR